MAHKFVIQNNAYLKFYLHAAKHPHTSVVGVLLGSKSSGETWKISDAIPLVHHWTDLSPMVEVGLEIAQTYAKDNGLQIIGLYQANTRAVNTDLSGTGYQILESLSKDFPPAFALVLDVSKLQSNEPALQISMTQKQAGAGDKFDLEDDAIPSRAISAAREGRLQARLADFDDYLEDVNADWLRNATVVGAES